MNNLWPTIIIVVVVIIVFGAMWFGWRRRVARDAKLRATTTAPASFGDETAHAEIFYVATTYHERPLDRAAVAGLGFRARAQLAVHAGGVSLRIPGQSTIYFAATAIEGVGVATWTIDRVVERDGLVYIAWRTEPAGVAKPATVLDSYIRVIDPADRDRVVAAIIAIAPHTSTAIAHNTDSTESEA